MELEGERDSYREIRIAISMTYRIGNQTYPQMYPQSNGVEHDSRGQFVVWMHSGENTPSRFALPPGAVAPAAGVKGVGGRFQRTPLGLPAHIAISSFCDVGRNWQSG